MKLAAAIAVLSLIVASSDGIKTVNPNVIGCCATKAVFKSTFATCINKYGCGQQVNECLEGARVCKLAKREKQ